MNDTPVFGKAVTVRGTALGADDTRERYRQKLARITLDSMVQFVGLLDVHGTVLEINQVALDGVGVRLADVEARPFWTTFWWQVSPEINAELRAMIGRAAAGEFVRWDAEIFGRAGGTETIIIDASLMPVKDDSGQVVFITAEGRDITEKKAQEREIARQREELARLDVLKTQFFANISHEFRTPLTLMLGPIEDALDDTPSLDDRQRERLAMVQRNGLRLQKLVNTLLDFSRVEAGRMQASYQATDLAAMTQDLAASFRAACEKAGLDFVVDTPPLPWPIHVDREMWEKIVLNLVSNAFKFTLAGAITVRLAAADDRAVLTVADTGSGIPADELPLIFDRFHRVEGAVGRSHEGTGIGLALVRELVGLHKGTIDVDSTPGRGTTFTVRLPAGRDHLPADHVDRPAPLASTATRAEAFVSEALRWLPDGAPADAPVDTPAAAKAAPVPVDRPRIVVADDNADMRDYLVRLLSDAYDVSAVADGEAAFAEARRLRPHLVLSDVMMPRLDGFGLLRRMRADTGLRDTAVLLLSARAGEEAKVEGLQAGADDYLVKPFSARELLARVHANVELARSRRHTARVLRDEARLLRVLNRTATALAGEIELEPLVQAVTDAATELTGAQFGAFFYNVTNDAGESYLLHTISGVPKERFASFPQPRNTAVFGPTFAGEGIVRSPDIRQDPRYGHNAPHHGIPAGHLPVVSYLAVPVVSAKIGERGGEVLGGLFFGHPEPDRFSEHHELIVAGVASQAAAAFEKARLYEASRKAEADLRRLNETLEQRIAEAVAARMKVEEALRQSQKMEAIGQLTGGVAHDFNNLLQVVVGNLDNLKRRLASPVTPLRGDMMRAIDGAMTGAQRGATLTQRLLAFSRRQSLDPRPLEVNRLVSGMSDLLRSTLGESVAIETVLGGGLWRVSADANQLESAILNLAVNARDAMPTGGKLTIGTANAHLDAAHAGEEPEVQPGQYVMLAVSDTGTGMTREVAAQAFDPFFTTKAVGQGTGLGLSQVYGFVKQSAGHVRIDSQPGQGTTVRIYLPRLASDLAPDVEPAAESAPVGAGETILLVEDDETVRELSLAMLEDLGYVVRVAEDGPRALRMLESAPGIRLLFTDIGLPGMNGSELAERARALRPDLRVLFTTGYARSAAVHHGGLEPGIDLLAKPFTLAALAQKLRELLDRR